MRSLKNTWRTFSKMSATASREMITRRRKEMPPPVRKSMSALWFDEDPFEGESLAPTLSIANGRVQRGWRGGEVEKIKRELPWTRQELPSRQILPGEERGKSCRKDPPTRQEDNNNNMIKPWHRPCSRPPRSKGS